jgi:hypothetical protein
MNPYPTESYHPEQRLGTAGCGWVVILVAGLAFAQCDELYAQVLPTVNYVETSSTVGQFRNVFAHGYEAEVADFETSIADFYSTLLADQEPLGKEFEQCLYENLGDFYVCS